MLVGLRELEVLEQDLQDTFEACIGGPSVGCSMLGSVVDIFTLSEVVFVFTDIQDSTAMFASDPVAMKCAPNCSPNIPSMFPQRAVAQLVYDPVVTHKPHPLLAPTESQITAQTDAPLWSPITHGPVTAHAEAASPNNVNNSEEAAGLSSGPPFYRRCSECGAGLFVVLYPDTCRKCTTT